MSLNIGDMVEYGWETFTPRALDDKGPHPTPETYLERIAFSIWNYTDRTLTLEEIKKIFFGDKQVVNITYGDIEVQKVYVGETLVWER